MTAFFVGFFVGGFFGGIAMAFAAAAGHADSAAECGPPYCRPGLCPICDALRERDAVSAHAWNQWHRQEGMSL